MVPSSGGKCFGSQTGWPAPLEEGSALGGGRGYTPSANPCWRHAS